MRNRFFFVLFLILSILLLVPSPSLAQSGRVKAPASVSLDTRPAQALYEEANSYIDKKFEEFRGKHLHYDPKLEADNRQEQKELATRHAITLAARGQLAGPDHYYLGMLQHLADDSDGALDAMHRLLKDH